MKASLSMTETVNGESKYVSFNYTDKWGICKTNKPDMKCPRCSAPLEIEIEHRCGTAYKPSFRKA